MAVGTTYLVAGFISRTHGLKGELKVKLSSPFSFADMLVSGALMLEVKGKPVPFLVEQFNETGQDVIIKLEDINRVEEATKLMGYQVMAPEELFEETPQAQLNLLVGFILIDKNSGLIGPISEVEEMPAHPVLKINRNGQELLIPLVEDFIIEIKKRKKEIHVELPDGLLDLNS